MIVTFEQVYLKELYVSGKTSDKKHRFQPDIIKDTRIESISSCISRPKKNFIHISLYTLKRCKEINEVTFR